MAVSEPGNPGAPQVPPRPQGAAASPQPLPVGGARPQPIPPARPMPIPAPAANSALPPTTTGQAPAAPRPIPASAPRPIPAGANPAAPQPIPAGPQAAQQPAAAPRPLPASAPLTASAPRPIPAGAAPAGPGGVPVLRVKKPEEEQDEQLKKAALRMSPPMLISSVFHMIVIIILGLWALKPEKTNRDVVLSASYSDVEGQQLFDDSTRLAVEQPQLVEQAVMSASTLIVDDPFAAPPNLDIALGGSTASSMIKAPTMGIALAGREEGMKKVLLGSYGGSADSETAVQMGLEWLERFQQKNGTWSLKGPYSSGADFENFESATAMALLAFQGAGHSHKSGKYAKTVADGLKHLLTVQKRDGDFFQSKQADEWLYCQAQCTIVICELYGMTHDPELKEPAERAVKFCIEAQDELGGWRYRPRSDSDTSVTGWMVMALQSAKMAGLMVPTPTLSRINDYLDKAATDEGLRYAYLPGYSDHTLAMTAEALLCRQYLGWRKEDPRLVEGAKYVADNPPKWSERDVYYWYYATQMLHHMEGDLWNNWNSVMRDLLVGKQEQKGRERGSWDPRGKDPDVWAMRGQGGRLYVTCLSLYMLEVYYRHLPMYSQIKKDIEAAVKEQ
jgi:hypothetical protein